ncbi:MAG: T9SS type A sorting domain-containing protein, partial [Bacteroidota bacterium]
NICGDSVIFNPITNYPSNVSNLAYSWIPANSLNSATIKNPVAKPITTTNYVVSLTSVEGCFATDTIQVTVNPMTVNAGNDINLACGGNVILTPNNNYPGLQSNLSYQWNPTIGLDSVNIANPKVNPLSTNTYYLNLSSIEGCNAIDSIKVNIIPLSISTNNITKTCGDSITFGATINSNSTSIVYHWTPANGLSNPGILNPRVNPIHTITYILNAIDQSCIASDTVIVNVTNANFNLEFTASDTLFATPPFTVQFNNSTPDITNYNFTWNFGDNTILNSNNAIVNHTYYSNGMYSVSLIATDILNSCSDTIFKTAYISCNGLGINQQSTSSFKFNIFPNPNKGEFNLLLTGTKADHYNINISSIIGEIIYNESVQSIDNNFQKNIHLTNIPKGLYFVTISSKQGKIIKKVVIQ